MLKYGNYFVMKKLLTEWLMLNGKVQHLIKKFSGHGYYNYSDVAGTIRDYDNGEIVDIPHNDINLYDFVRNRGWSNDLLIINSLIHLNMSSAPKVVQNCKKTNIDSSNNIIRLNYDQVVCGKLTSLLLFGK